MRAVCPPSSLSVRFTAFTGTFNGLGNNVSNLALTGVLGETGLFGQVGAGGVVANVGLVGASISGNGNTGALVGLNSGTVSNVTATGSVTGVNSAAIGGLVGANAGTITGASANILVTGMVSSTDGGLVGSNNAGGTIANSHTTGTVQGGNDSANGGLVGVNFGAISNSYSTQTVTGTSSGAYANGGLVGDNYGTGSITDSYATGAVHSPGASLYAGGLSGYNQGQILNSYATGSVSADAGTLYVGGLVGLNTLAGTITSSFAVGPTTGPAGATGGLVGTDSGLAVVNSYWDIGTTGQSMSAAGTGKTTFELQSALLTGFTGADWSIVQGKSYPYLNFQFAGTPQVVAGTVYTDGGTTNAGAGITVNAVADGNALTSALTGGTVTTAADGYYYYLLAPGTVAANGNVIVSAEHYGTGSAQSGRGAGRPLERLSHPSRHTGQHVPHRNAANRSHVGYGGRHRCRGRQRGFDRPGQWPRQSADRCIRQLQYRQRGLIFQRYGNARRGRDTRPERRHYHRRHADRQLGRRGNAEREQSGQVFWPVRRRRILIDRPSIHRCPCFSNSWDAERGQWRGSSERERKSDPRGRYNGNRAADNLDRERRDLTNNRRDHRRRFIRQRGHRRPPYRC